MSASLWGKIGGAGVGLAIGGPMGALLGALAGHVLIDGEDALLRRPPRDVVFATALVALSAKMAKSDGVVVRSEVDAFERIVEVPPPEHERIKRLFDLAKATTDGFETYARQVAGLFADEPALLEDVLDGLFHIAKADGAVHEREFSYLKAVAREFGLGDADFSRIAASHLKHPDDPYEVLGADRRMSDADLKRLYRKRVSESHPDREIARGLPAEAIRIATERLAAINAAWARIEAERGLT